MHTKNKIQQGKNRELFSAAQFKQTNKQQQQKSKQTNKQNKINLKKKKIL